MKSVSYMIEQKNLSLHMLRCFGVGLIIVASLFLFSMILSTADIAGTSRSSSLSASGTASHYNNDPNVITGGAAELASEVGQSTAAAGAAAGSAVSSAAGAVGSAAIHTGKFFGGIVSSSGRFAGRMAQNSVNFAAQSISSSVASMVNTPAHVFGVITNVAVVSNVIKPADSTQIPAIDPGFSAKLASRPEIQPALIANQPAVAADPLVDWPIHGAITTQFGVPHWPYQPTHTGLDISDGQRSGVTPVKPFKGGKVIETVSSNSGLGNHVVIDHGNGLTSVYGHLASISVKVDQVVNRATTLGFAGSTGASTGTHLHLEIRINGQPKDPRLYITGQP